MIEKVKNAALYLATPLVLLFGAIWYLVSSNRTLRQELEEANASKTDAGLEAKEGSIDEEANDSAALYARARDRFLSEYSKSNPLGGPPNMPADLPSGGQGSGGPEGSNPDPGSKASE